jgi:hypothetical protein
MFRRMTIDEQKMQAMYDNIMFEVRNEFHIHSTDLRTIKLTEEEWGEMIANEGLGHTLSSMSSAGMTNKKTKHLTNPNVTNGLPRKRIMFKK